jgi:DNA replication protein DnaC
MVKLKLLETGKFLIWDGVMFQSKPNIGKYLDPIFIKDLLCKVAKEKYIKDKVFVEIPQYQSIAKWIAWDETGLSPSKGLFFVGGKGNGKTTLLLATMEVIRMLNDTRYTRVFSMSDLGLKFQQSKDYSLITRLFCGNTAIDDIGYGTETVNDYGIKINLFDSIIAQRDFNRKFENHYTFISTNLSKSQREERYDERTLDRLKDLTNYVSFEKLASFRGAK